MLCEEVEEKVRRWSEHDSCVQGTGVLDLVQMIPRDGVTITITNNERNENLKNRLYCLYIYILPLFVFLVV